ncbi:MAG: hypothetical protein KKF42_07205 [Actinobacteria bacterium]|nr:hypothetical protein [Actinomycetota bacterium]
MNIDLPAIPAGILILLAFFAPYAIAIINHPSWDPKWKRLVAIVVSIVLALVVMVLYYLMTGDLIPQWPVLLLLAIVVTQAAYALVLKPSAKSVEAKHGAQ